MKLLLLTVFCLSTSVSTAQSDLSRLFNTLLQGDAVPVNKPEADLFSKAVCNGDVTKRGNCTVLVGEPVPLIELENGPALIPFSVLYGSFSDAGTQEALVGLVVEGTDCCRGDAALLQREGTEWRLKAYLGGQFYQSYLVFPKNSGGSVIVGYSRVDSLMTGLSVLSFSVRALDLEGSGGELLLDFKNPGLSCRYPPAPGARYAEVLTWSRRDVNLDGLPDLVLEVQEGELAPFVCDNIFVTEPELLGKHSYEAVFLFNGQTFEPTQAAQRLKHFSQAEQGRAHEN